MYHAMMRWHIFMFALVGLAVPVSSAAGPDFYGTWLITEAHVAPWAKPEDAAFSAEEQRRLIGGKVIYAKSRITGPAPLACAKPRYRQFDAPPDYLFQGGLTDPVRQAQTLGFHPRAIPTLETGCEGEIDFHFVDDRTALFALNNMIYTLRKR